ncbi:hypothetical protein VSF3289_01709 [Vibrio scophthalmi]|uniref:Uncharacterized protein n=1 Tax=Vibrio scophthalmi TaxID=45658 RepID=A0A1E3WNW9_9VIBR|nr:hypothetical protein VSF3289_01709 [Vibrio scophthalmi]
MISVPNVVLTTNVLVYHYEKGQHKLTFFILDQKSGLAFRKA